jgi:hypothetical protein
MSGETVPNDAVVWADGGGLRPHRASPRMSGSPDTPTTTLHRTGATVSDLQPAALVSAERATEVQP